MINLINALCFITQVWTKAIQFLSIGILFESIVEKENILFWENSQNIISTKYSHIAATELCWLNHCDAPVQGCSKCMSNDVTSLYHCLALSPWPVSNVDNNTLPSTKAHGSSVIYCSAFNTLTSGRYTSNLKIIIIVHLLQSRLMSTPEILLRWMPSSDFEVNIGSGDSLVMQGNKPFPGAILTLQTFSSFLKLPLKMPNVRCQP